MGKQGNARDTRHGTNSGSGSNEPKHNEKKEERGFVSRQGGDQTRPGVNERPNPDQDSNSKTQGDETRGPAPTAQRPHLEGSEQGPA